MHSLYPGRLKAHSPDRPQLGAPKRPVDPDQSAGAHDVPLPTIHAIATTVPADTGHLVVRGLIEDAERVDHAMKAVIRVLPALRDRAHRVVQETIAVVAQSSGARDVLLPLTTHVVSVTSPANTEGHLIGHALINARRLNRKGSMNMTRFQILLLSWLILRVKI